MISGQWAYKVQYFLGSTEEKEIFYISNQEKQRFSKVHVIIHSIKQNNFLLLNLRYSVFLQTFNIMPWCSKYCCSHACFTMFNPSNKSYISGHNSKVHNMFYSCVLVIVSTEDLKEALKPMIYNNNNHYYYYDYYNRIKVKSNNIVIPRAIS